MIGGLLSSALTPPHVQAALFEVLKSLPGATLVDGVTDPQGRTGVGVRFQDDAWDTLFLFDPASGHLLGTRSIGHQEVEGRDIADWSLSWTRGGPTARPHADIRGCVRAQGAQPCPAYTWLIRRTLSSYGRPAGREARHTRLYSPGGPSRGHQTLIDGSPDGDSGRAPRI